MKKVLILLFILILITISLSCYFTCKDLHQTRNVSLVLDNGFLHINGTSLENQNNQPFTLTGFSSSGIQWTNNILNKENLQVIRDNFGTNAFRIAMYTEENGYIKNPDKIYNDVISLTNTLIDLDMYIVIDWHILSDVDPNTHINESKEFFEKYSAKYADIPNIIYEICNEPGSTKVTWKDYIKPYAETIIPIIRNNSPESIIIVGTPQNCQKFREVIEEPLTYPNIMYANHIYVGSDVGYDVKENIKELNKYNLPIIVSEWGLTDETGDGELYENKATELVKFFEENHISSFNWSFSNTPTSSSILKSSYNPETDKNILNKLSPSGKIMRKIFLNR